MKKIMIAVALSLLVTLSSIPAQATSAVLIRPATSNVSAITHNAITPDVLRKVDGFIISKYGFKPAGLWTLGSTGFYRVYTADTGWGSSNGTVVLSWNGDILFNEKNVGQWDKF